MELSETWIQQNQQVFARRKWHRDYQRRPKRHNLPMPLEVMARPNGMRFYVFSLHATNISASGFYLESPTRVFIPFRVGTLLQATVDLRCCLFVRPLHIALRVARISETPSGGISIGVQILSVEASQCTFFWDGLGKLGPLDAME